MKSNAGLKLARPFRDTKAVDKVVTEFPCATTYLFNRRTIRFLLELQRCAMEHHRRAGARGDNNRLLPGENFRRVSHNFTCSRPLAAVESGLTAASLILGKLDITTGVLKHFHRRAGDIVIKGITQTRGHQLDTACFRAGG
jgi:hypothetical protein